MRVKVGPSLSKKLFPVGRVGGGSQSGGREYFFLLNYIFYKLKITVGWSKKKKKGPVGPF